MADDTRVVQERLLDLIADSTKAAHQVARRLDALERRFETLETALNERVSRLEEEMRVSNAHLVGINTAADTTNDLLQRLLAQNEKEFDHRLKIAEEERKARAAELTHQRQLQKENRAVALTVGTEMWQMFRGPLGYLLVGVAAWLTYNVLGVRIEALIAPEQVEIVAPAPADD